MRGRPTPRKGPDGRWHVYLRWTLPSGLPQRKHLADATYQGCMDKLEKAERAIADGNAPSPKKGTVDAYAQTWLGMLSDLRPKTVRGYESHLRHHVLPVIGRLEMTKVTRAETQSVLDSMRKKKTPSGKPVSIATVANVKRTMHAMFNEAIADRIITINPVDHTRTGKNRAKRTSPHDVESARRVIDVASTRPGGVRWLFGMATGCRQGEVLALRWMDLDLDNSSVDIHRSLNREPWQHGCADPVKCASRKCRTEPCPSDCNAHQRQCPPPCPLGCTKHASTCPSRHSGGIVIFATKTEESDRVIDLPDSLVTALREHRRAAAEKSLANGRPMGDEDPIFPGVSGGWKCPSRDWREWKQVLRDADVEDKRIHDMRHFLATLMLDLEVDTHVVREHLGHTTEHITRHYQHVHQGMTRKAMSKVDAALFGQTGTT